MSRIHVQCHPASVQAFRGFGPRCRFRQRKPPAHHQKSVSVLDLVSVVVHSPKRTTLGRFPIDATEFVPCIFRRWEYIKAHSLQDQAAKRKINCDSALKAVFNKDQIDMNEIMGGVSPHLTKVEVPAAPQQLK